MDDNSLQRQLDGRGRCLLAIWQKLIRAFQWDDNKGILIRLDNKTLNNIICKVMVRAHCICCCGQPIHKSAQALSHPGHDSLKCLKWRLAVFENLSPLTTATHKWTQSQMNLITHIIFGQFLIKDSHLIPSDSFDRHLESHLGKCDSRDYGVGQQLSGQHPRGQSH